MKLKFIDLFCGIGGFRQALEKRGHQCVFSSDWDPHAQWVYQKNYGEIPFGDLSKLRYEDAPVHDLLSQVFPASHLVFPEINWGSRMIGAHFYMSCCALPEPEGRMFFSWKMLEITSGTITAVPMPSH